jgi:hypothetical protein
MVILIIKCTDVICRVPYIVLSHRLSILYLRTCVGLGYGKRKKWREKSKIFPVIFFFSIIFLAQLILDFLLFTHLLRLLNQQP